MKKIDHSLLILRKNFENSGHCMYAICVGWVNFVHSLRSLLKNLRSQQKFSYCKYKAVFPIFLEVEMEIHLELYCARTRES